MSKQPWNLHNKGKNLPEEDQDQLLAHHQKIIQILIPIMEMLSLS